MNSRFDRKETRWSGFCVLRSLIIVAALVQAPLAPSRADEGRVVKTALYPHDNRRPMLAGDYRRFPGAGILFCNDANQIPQEAAASWLIGNANLVMTNAHNFVDRNGVAVRQVGDCFFQIGGRNYEFDPKTVRMGITSHATRLHITDDWALIHLRNPVDAKVWPQPIPSAAQAIPIGFSSINVTMVSPAGHANFRSATNSIEECQILEIDPPSEDRIRRARHDCNDGFGGSGSGLFDDQGHMLAMHSASLDMNRNLPFDIDLHYGSALLIEGSLLDAIREMAKQ